MMSPAQYEAEIDRLGAALELEVRARAAAAEMAAGYKRKVDHALELMDLLLCEGWVPPALREEVRGVISGRWPCEE